MHASLPTVGLYFPAAHEAHDCASGPVKPAAQPACTQSARASLPAGELLPAGQAIQVDTSTAPEVPEYLPVSQKEHGVLPTVLLYVPAEHIMHDPPSGPENPALHLQPVLAVDPATD